jgi:2-polyprenyl-3-methyl-5-hydroxy-6-metoxy-1,4-benzoquinol methylase
MHLGIVGDNLLERMALRLNLVPVPIAHTHLALLLARTVIEASRAGVFEALEDSPGTAGEIAARCGLDPAAAAKLLSALTTSGYLHYEKRSARYSSTAVARKWMLPKSAQSIHEQILFTPYEDEWIVRMGEYLRTGREVNGGGHQGIPRGPEVWGSYQRAMRAIAGLGASEVARRMAVPRGARDMLDIGGSHGLYSVAICRRHPGLSAVVLDLPDAVEHAAPLLAAESMGDRVKHWAANALTADLGENRYDLIFHANLAHHFDEPTNRDLMKRMARALRPGGVAVVQELIRRDTPTQGGQMGALLDLFFSMTSEAGTWSLPDIAAWQRDAGLQPRKPFFLRTIPGSAQQSAVKPPVPS